MQPAEPVIISNATKTEAPINSDAFSNNSSTEGQKPNHQKAVTILLAVTSVVLLIATVVLLCLYLLRQPSNESSDITASTDIVDRTETGTTNEEVEITDESVLRDLDEKIAILHYTDQTGNYFEKHVGIYFNVIDMYNSGYLEPVGARVMQIIDYLGDSYFRPLSTEEISAAWDEETSAPGQYDQDFKTLLASGIDGAIVAEKYKDVFGKDLYEEEYSTKGSCIFYHYNQSFDFYYISPLGGCGGTSPLYSHHYKTKYTVAGDYAYVYIAGALESRDSGNVYCGIYAPDQLYDRTPLCDFAGENDTFVLDDTSYEKYTLYRFVFTKADDGTYYFVKVEPVNNE